MAEVKKRIFELDNAGTVFPGQNISTWSNTFRVAVELKEEVDEVTLKKALDKTLVRLPGFKVRMKKGTFRYCFEENTADCHVRKDISNFCYRVNYKEDNGYLFRVYYYGKKISMDVYHALCDGYGATVFLCTLTGEYLRLRGHSISTNNYVLDVEAEPSSEETEDSYKRYADSDMKYNYPSDWVYHRRATKLPAHITNYTVGTIPFSQLHKISKSYNVTVTELLSAILIEIHYKKMLSEGKNKAVSVQIPVNLRKAFPSRSLRNFVLCLRAWIDPSDKEYTFEEILSRVSSQLRSVNKAEILNSMMTKNVKMETQTTAFLPAGLKNLFIGIGFHLTAEKSTSVLISNLGSIDFPEDMKPYVERCFLYTGPGLVNGARCGVASCGDKLCFTFSNCYREGDIEREFFTRLTELGVDVTVETNRRAEALRWAELFKVNKDAFPSDIYIP